jgi:YjbE family integral membrane protein
MEWSTLSGIASIILIDLVLSGDNALVIGMAARDLPAPQRRWAILWGTVAAIGLRVTFTILAALLLFNFAGLRLAGGSLLIWIAIKLLVKPPAEGEVEVGRSLWEAIRIIVLADIVMSLDNVLAVAGASHGNLALLIFGLALSIPLLMGGATIVSHMLNRWSPLIWLGGAVLAWVAAEMIAHDPLLHDRLQQIWPALPQIIPLFVTLGVMGTSYIWVRRRSRVPLKSRH